MRKADDTLVIEVHAQPFEVTRADFPCVIVR